MGVLGRRIKNNLEDEPTLLGDIDAIIQKAKNKGMISNYVVDIKAIVEDEGIKIKKEDLPSSFSGYLKKNSNNWIIGVNKNHSDKRQRFTITHEFAHYILHRKDDQDALLWRRYNFFQKGK